MKITDVREIRKNLPGGSRASTLPVSGREKLHGKVLEILGKKVEIV